jgi:predicted glutamine amidotransferase
VQRRHPFTAATLTDEDLSVDFAAHTTPQDRVAVVATEPLTRNEDWVPFAVGELRVFEGGVQH